MRSIGFTEQEIQHAVAQEQSIPHQAGPDGRADAETTAVPAQGNPALGNEQTRTGDGLTVPTREDVLSKGKPSPMEPTG